MQSAYQSSVGIVNSDASPATRPSWCLRRIHSVLSTYSGVALPRKKESAVFGGKLAWDFFACLYESFSTLICSLATVARGLPPGDKLGSLLGSLLASIGSINRSCSVRSGGTFAFESGSLASFLDVPITDRTARRNEKIALMCDCGGHMAVLAAELRKPEHAAFECCVKHIIASALGGRTVDMDAILCEIMMKTSENEPANARSALEYDDEPMDQLVVPFVPGILEPEPYRPMLMAAPMAFGIIDADAPSYPLLGVRDPRNLT